MKFLEIPELARLAQALTHEGPECSVHTRIEAYSLKSVNKDKKLFRSLETTYKSEASNSPPLPSFISTDREEITPFGPMSDKGARKTFHLLIATLNAAFPDYEFSEAKYKDFNKEASGASVLNALSTTLVSPNRGNLAAPRTYSAYPPTSSGFFPSSVPTSSSPLDFAKPSPYAPTKTVAGTHPSLYRVLNDAIGLDDCEVYSYEPDVEYDPHANDSDDEEDAASVGDEDSSEEEEPTTFQFDDYDVDEAPRRSGWGGAVSSDESDEYTPHIRMKRRGALLWSSHWFFLNKKLKRILFITVWARSKNATSWMDLDDSFSFSNEATAERFRGWEGAVGAGARALGLSATV
ncbi:Maf1-domain-containing protein [Trametopsis cervina]|nr:Maf1-domain-containing protein [Trametopsis cervina]